MATRKIEIFSAGCDACQDVVAQVEAAASPSCSQDADMTAARCRLPSQPSTLILAMRLHY